MSKKRRSLNDGELRLGDDPEGDALVGSKCRTCGRYFFPKRKNCAACCEPSTEEVLLSKSGKLLSYSTVEKKPKNAWIQSPYIIGEVVFPEGVVVCTVLECNPRDLIEGSEFRLSTTKIREDHEGNEVLAYLFKPVVNS